MNEDMKEDIKEDMKEDIKLDMNEYIIWKERIRGSKQERT